MVIFWQQMFFLLKIVYSETHTQNASVSARSDDEDDDYEIPDSEINKILIVTQTPPAYKKHPQGDRTGDHTPRSKITAEMHKLINDGLYYYEQDLWDDSDELMVGIIAQAGAAKTPATKVCYCRVGLCVYSPHLE